MDRPSAKLFLAIVQSLPGRLDLLKMSSIDVDQEMYLSSKLAAKIILFSDPLVAHDSQEGRLDELGGGGENEERWARTSSSLS